MPNGRIAVVAAALLASVTLPARYARAETPAGPAVTSPAIGQQPLPPPPPEHRSIGVAIGLSLAGAAVGLVATAASAGDADRNPAGAAVGLGLLSIGPSVGELYAGGTWKALIFSSARGLCSGVLLYEFAQGHLGGEQPDNAAGDRAGLAVLGLLSLTIVSIADAGVAADDFNVRHRPPPRFGVGVAPLLAPARSADGARVGLDAGLTLAGHF